MVLVAKVVKLFNLFVAFRLKWEEVKKKKKMKPLSTQTNTHTNGLPSQLELECEE